MVRQEALPLVECIRKGSPFLCGGFAFRPGTKPPGCTESGPKPCIGRSAVRAPGRRFPACMLLGGKARIQGVSISGSGETPWVYGFADTKPPECMLFTRFPCIRRSWSVHPAGFASCPVTKPPGCTESGPKPCIGRSAVRAPGRRFLACMLLGGKARIRGVSISGSGETPWVYGFADTKPPACTVFRPIPVHREKPSRASRGFRSS